MINNMNFNSNWKIITKQSFLEDVKKDCYKEVILEKLPDEIFRENESWLYKDITLPTCWENEGIIKPFTGPVWFVKKFKIGSNNKARILKLNAVSYYCRVWLNGKLLGEHRGMWDSFQFDITNTAKKDNTLVLEVHKTGGIFDTKECLTGFIPYVTSTFGGIWQDVELIESNFQIENLKVAPVYSNDNKVNIQFDVLNHKMETVKNVEFIFNNIQYHEDFELKTGKNCIIFDLPISGDKKFWSHTNPYLYDLNIKIDDCSYNAKIGLRNISTEGAVFKINEQPVYLRGVLNWMAYTDTIAPIFSEERIREEMLKIKSLGFNLIKLCLVIPEEKYFEIADELGMYLWIEFPLWLPKVTDCLKTQAQIEYKKLAKRIRKHPSVIIYSLGCELNSEADAEFLNELNNIVKSEINDELLAQNSGSGEAYGGVETGLSDFYDYHFYTETYHFTNLYNYFYPLWKESKPLFFGEYCDCDSFRSISLLKKQLGVKKLWWTENDPIENPQGVRWEYNVTEAEERINKLSTTYTEEELVEFSKHKPLECRKDIVEQTRRLSSTSGYVITVNIDTPVSTSGIIDDLGNIKYSVEEFKKFNSDCVLLIERGKRRIFRFGDRPQFIDEFNGWQGDEIGLNVILSNYADNLDKAVLEYKFKFHDTEIAGNFDLQNIKAGNVQNLAYITAEIPKYINDYSFTVECKLKDKVGKIISENSWTMNALKKVDYLNWDLNLFDWSNYLYHPERYCDKLINTDPFKTIENYKINVFTSWSDKIADMIRANRKVLLIIPEGAPFTEEHSFFRECLPYFEKDSFLKNMPFKNYAGIDFKGIGPDKSINKDLAGKVLEIELKSVMTRIDEIRFMETFYILEGKNIIITTLRLFGGLTGQPVGLHKNVMGTYIFNRCVEKLNND